MSPVSKWHLKRGWSAGDDYFKNIATINVTWKYKWNYGAEPVLFPEFRDLLNPRQIIEQNKGQIWNPLWKLCTQFTKSDQEKLPWLKIILMEIGKWA